LYQALRRVLIWGGSYIVMYSTYGWFRVILAPRSCSRLSTWNVNVHRNVKTLVLKIRRFYTEMSGVAKPKTDHENDAAFLVHFWLPSTNQWYHSFNHIPIRYLRKDCGIWFAIGVDSPTSMELEGKRHDGAIRIFRFPASHMPYPAIYDPVHVLAYYWGYVWTNGSPGKAIFHLIRRIFILHDNSPRWKIRRSFLNQ